MDYQTKVRLFGGILRELDEDHEKAKQISEIIDYVDYVALTGINWIAFTYTEQHAQIVDYSSCVPLICIFKKCLVHVIH